MVWSVSWNILRREVRRLNVELKSRENVIQRQDFASSWKAVPEAGAILERLEQEKVSLRLRSVKPLKNENRRCLKNLPKQLPVLPKRN